MKMSPVMFDGVVYVGIAVCSAVVASLSSDGAHHFLKPAPLWLTTQVAEWFGAGLLALKMYRSTTFAEYRAAKNGSYHAPDKDDVAGSLTNADTKQNETKTNTPAVSGSPAASSL